MNKIALLLALAVGAMFPLTVSIDNVDKDIPVHVESVEVSTQENVEDVTPVTTTTPTTTVTTTETETVTAPQKITYRVTAYCACSKCCGKWANNRPVDSNGNPIVIGAAGVQLIPNISCGNVNLPFGTQVKLDGYGTVTVHDRGADWLVDKFGENYIDIYMSDHNKARQFGLKYLEGVIL